MALTAGKNRLARLPPFLMDGTGHDWTGRPIVSSEADRVPICWTRAGIEIFGLSIDSSNAFVRIWPDSSANQAKGGLLKVPRFICLSLASDAVYDAIVLMLEQNLTRVLSLGILLAVSIDFPGLLGGMPVRNYDNPDTLIPAANEFVGGEMIVFATDLTSASPGDYAIQLAKYYQLQPSFSKIQQWYCYSDLSDPTEAANYARMAAVGSGVGVIAGFFDPVTGDPTGFGINQILAKIQNFFSL